jgi:hypothetical protein
MVLEYHASDLNQSLLSRLQALPNHEMIFNEDGHASMVEKTVNYFFIGLVAVAVKKILLMLLSSIILPVMIFKIMTFILFPIKFLIGMKALGLANAALMGLLFKTVLSPALPLNPSALR